MTVLQRLALLDTSFVLALENRDDPFHERAKSLASDFSRDNGIMLLHWGVLLEIGDGYARVQRREKGCRLLDKLRNEEGFRIVELTTLLLDVAITLYDERRDKNWGLTDCVSFALMRQEHIVEALTADVHFRQAGFQALLLD
jgi:predicted nucleic acid-binding protein